MLLSLFILTGIAAGAKQEVCVQSDKAVLYYFPFSAICEPPMKKADICSPGRRYFAVSGAKDYAKLFNFIVLSKSMKFRKDMVRLLIIENGNRWYFDADGNGIGPKGACSVQNPSGLEKWMVQASGLEFNPLSYRFEVPGAIPTKEDPLVMDQKHK